MLTHYLLKLIQPSMSGAPWRAHSEFCEINQYIRPENIPPRIVEAMGANACGYFHAAIDGDQVVFGIQAHSERW